jgi:hypothetical protein
VEESPFCEGGAPLPSRRYEGEEEIADAALRAFVRTAIQVRIVRSAPPHRRYSECSPAGRLHSLPPPFPRTRAAVLCLTARASAMRESPHNVALQTSKQPRRGVASLPRGIAPVRLYNARWRTATS